MSSALSPSSLNDIHRQNKKSSPKWQYQSKPGPMYIDGESKRSAGN